MQLGRSPVNPCSQSASFRLREHAGESAALGDMTLQLTLVTA
jgi:hypothetical protein